MPVNVPEAAENEPFEVIFLNVPISLFASTTSALLAAAVPAVISSTCSRSDSTIVAEPIENPTAVIVPSEVKSLTVPISLFASTTITLEAEIVPAVTSSSCSNSASVITAEPIEKFVVNTGLASVLFVSVCEPVNVATVESIAVEILLLVTVVSIPVPPSNVIVSSLLIGSVEPLSAAILIAVVIVPKDNAPEPSVTSG